MKLIVEFTETPQGNVECVMTIPPCVATCKEKAYMDELMALLRVESLKFGRARGAVAIVLPENSNPADS